MTNSVTIEAGQITLTVSGDLRFTIQSGDSQLTDSQSSRPFGEAPKLRPGEKLICSISIPGDARYHLVLLPDANDDADHDTQLQWATEHGGDLPDLTEQALLRSYAPDEFEKRAYWSKQKHATQPGWAWYTNFDHGYQNFNRQDFKLPARAVRRISF